jgi:hypothetical protein
VIFYDASDPSATQPTFEEIGAETESERIGGPVVLTWNGRIRPGIVQSGLVTDASSISQHGAKTIGLLIVRSSHDPTLSDPAGPKPFQNKKNN